MIKRYAIIENDAVANIIVAENNPSNMTDLPCIEVDDTVQIGFTYDGEKFIQNESNNDNTIDAVDQL